MDAIAHDIAGERVLLLAQKAVWWPATKTLLVADVHLGKSETFRRAGVLLPVDDTADDLARLSALSAARGATRVIVLGDWVHHRDGLTEALAARVAAWRPTLAADLVLVRGNHDRAAASWPADWRLDDAGAVLREGPFVFVHEPPRSPTPFTWCGHVHPLARVAAGGDQLRLPCFHIRPELGVLPAFARFTAGQVVRARRGDALFAVAGDALVRL